MILQHLVGFPLQKDLIPLTRIELSCCQISSHYEIRTINYRTECFCEFKVVYVNGGGKLLISIFSKINHEYIWAFIFAPCIMQKYYMRFAFLNLIFFVSMFCDFQVMKIQHRQLENIIYCHMVFVTYCICILLSDLSSKKH